MKERNDKLQLKDEYLDAELRRRYQHMEEIVRQRDLECK